MKSRLIPLTLFFALAMAACQSAPTTVAPTPQGGNPGATQEAPTASPAAALPTETVAGPTGSISGALRPMNDSQGEVTSIRVYARQKNTAKVFGIEIPVGQTTYTISGLPFGTYTVFAWFYPKGMPGAYTSADVDVARTSSQQLKCSNSLVEVVLTESHPDYQGADIGCWAGDYFIYITPMP